MRYAKSRHYVYRIGISVLFLSCGLSAQLKQETFDAFDKCMKDVEAKIAQKQSSARDFVRISQGQPAYKTVVDDNGPPAIDEITPCNVRGALVHHWIGDIFIKGATIAQVLKILNDVQQFSKIYSPSVISGQLVSTNGDKHTVETVIHDPGKFWVTVTFDGTYEVTQGELDPQHVYSDSRSVQVKNVQDADHGVPWRLNTYWRLKQIPEGVIAECESISLTRTANKIIVSIASDIPRDRLKTTLEKTKNGVLSSAATNR